MSGYRIAARTENPLTVDVLICRKQRWWYWFRIWAALSVMTAGLGLPVMLVWLVVSRDFARRFARDYAVRIERGLLIVGSDDAFRSVPLESVAGASSRHGEVSVSVHYGKPLTLYGLRDPLAAVVAILEARKHQLVAADLEPQLSDALGGRNDDAGNVLRP